MRSEEIGSIIKTTIQQDAKIKPAMILFRTEVAEWADKQYFLMCGPEDPLFVVREGVQKSARTVAHVLGPAKVTVDGEDNHGEEEIKISWPIVVHVWFEKIRTNVTFKILKPIRDPAGYRSTERRTDPDLTGCRGPA